MGILCTIWEGNKVHMFENVLTVHSYIQQIGIKALKEAELALGTPDAEGNRPASAWWRHDYSE